MSLGGATFIRVLPWEKQWKQEGKTLGGTRGEGLCHSVLVDSFSNRALNKHPSCVQMHPKSSKDVIEYRISPLACVHMHARLSPVTLYMHTSTWGILLILLNYSDISCQFSCVTDDPHNNSDVPWPSVTSAHQEGKTEWDKWAGESLAPLPHLNQQTWPLYFISADPSAYLLIDERLPSWTAFPWFFFCSFAAVERQRRVVAPPSYQHQLERGGFCRRPADKLQSEWCQSSNFSFLQHLKQ